MRTSFGIFQEKKLMTVKEKYEDKENEGPWDGLMIVLLREVSPENHLELICRKGRTIGIKIGLELNDQVLEREKEWPDDHP